MTYPSLDGLVRPYQRELVEVFRRERAWLCTDEQGLGKSRAALLAPQLDRGVLVVCPAGVRGLEREAGRPVGGWLAEAGRVRPDLKRTRLEGNGALRWPEPGELCVASWETLRTTARGTALPLPTAPLALVLDEVHYAKNAAAQQTKAADRAVAAVLAAGGTAWGLTGTPIYKDPEDLKTITSVLRLYLRAFPGGDSDFGRVFRRELKTQVFGRPRCEACGKACDEKFADMFGKSDCCSARARKPKKVRSWVYGAPGPEAPERLRRVSLGRLMSDVTDLPEVVLVEHAVELDAAALLALGQLGKLNDEELLRAIERERVASDPDSHVARARAALAGAKRAVVPAVIDEVAGAGERVVLFADHRDPVTETVDARSGWGGVLGGRAWVHGEADARRETVIDRFAQGELAGIALTLGAGGTGVDGLQRAARHMVLLEESWSPSLVNQAVGRLRRLGQAGTVVLHKLVTGHEVEERVHAVVERKMQYLDVVDAARAPQVYGALF